VAATKRLTLGSDGYALIEQAHTSRLAELRNAKMLALSTDADDTRA
jgi:hypothetical protein